MSWQSRALKGATASMNLLNDTLGKRAIRDVPRFVPANRLQDIPVGMEYTRLKDGNYYNNEWLGQVHANLSVPNKPFTNNNPRMHWSQGERLPTEVAFTTDRQLPDGSIVAAFDAPDSSKGEVPLVSAREASKELKRYQQYLQSPDGRMLAYNSPHIEGDGDWRTGWRAIKYRNKFGFQDIPEGAGIEGQLLDNRIQLGMAPEINQIGDYYAGRTFEGTPNPITATLYPDMQQPMTVTTHRMPRGEVLATPVPEDKVRWSAYADYYRR